MKVTETKLEEKNLTKKIIIYISSVFVPGKMRSKSSGVENPADGVLVVPPGDHDINQEQEGGVPVKSLKARVQLEEGEDEADVMSEKEKLLLESTEAGDKRGDIKDLSKEDLLKLLGIMEGEVQVCSSPMSASQFVFACLNMHCRETRSL